MFPLRTWIILLLTLTIALISGLALFWHLRAQVAPRELAKRASPAYRMQIEGLRFDGIKQDQRVVSITADRFSLQKGKIAFFRTGLTQTALLENAIIDIYDGTKSSPGEVPERRSAEPSTAVEASSRESFNFGNLFAEETFSSLFPIRNVTTIEVSPVTIRLRREKAILTQITAASASIRLREQEILFTGNVGVSSGGAELTTEQLVFLPGAARLKLDHPFRLKRGDRTIEGANLTTDIFLRPY